MPDRARLRELLAHRTTDGGYWLTSCEIAEVEDALPGLLDALDEAEKALREIAAYRGKVARPVAMRAVAREALARIGGE